MHLSTIGVNVDDFNLSPQAGAAPSGGALFPAAVEMATVAGDVAPSNLSASGRRHLARFVDGLGLQLGSLVADVPGLRLTDPHTVDERVARTCQVLDLAADMKVPVVTASSGALTHPDTGEPSSGAIQALARIGEWADGRGVVFALRPTQDDGDRMASVLEELRCSCVRACFDPAALAMAGANPLAFLERLAGHIGLMHARDAVAGGGGNSGYETRLGEGDVDLVGVLGVLDAIDYAGPCILRRTDSANPAADLAAGRDLLKRLLPGG